MLAMILAILVNYLAHMDAARVVCERNEGFWSETYGCQDREPVTCAECVEAEDCNRLCGVGPCEACGQRGCWMPEDLNCNAKVRP